jgi:hypothetical protein
MSPTHSLNEDFPDAHAATDLPQALFHRLRIHIMSDTILCGVIRKRTSPARKMETPQIFPSKPTPSYCAPYTRSVTVSLESPFRGAYSGRFDNPGHNGQMVQALFDEQTNDPVRIEDKISPGRIFVPDDGVQRLQLRSSTKREYRWRRIV